MKAKIKEILILLLIISIIIGAIYFVYRAFRKKAEEQKEIQKETAQQELVIGELAEKYNALTEWDKNINYTIQLQNLLLNSDRPIVFKAYVNDIFTKNKQYYIHFVSDILTRKSSGPEIHFILTCNYDKILEILNEAEKDPTNFGLFKSLFATYAVVAKIDNIEKATLRIGADQEGEVEYEPGDSFIVTGKCIDFSHINMDLVKD
jgi:type II secretory pathway pseudopilin PulG